MTAATILPAVFCAAPASAQFALHDGDTVVFLGAGVTVQHQYTRMVESFVRLRYPEHKIRFFNAGQIADTCENALARLPIDVLPHKPNVAVVSYGRYDGRFERFSKENYEQYKAGMRKLLDALAANKVRVVLCGPAPVDPDRKYQGRDLKEYNTEVLARYGDFCRREAAARNLIFADLFSPVLAAHKHGKAEKRPWSVFDEKESVLLSQHGHLVCAAALLRAMAANDQVGRVAGELVKGDKDLQVQYVDGRTDGPSGARHAVSWSDAAGAALPLKDVRRPVPLFRFPGVAAGPQVAAAVPAGAAMNDIHFKLAGLPKGHFHLRLDGRPVGTWSADQLKEGVRLISDATTPARTQLDNDLERLWAGITLKDALVFKRREEKDAKAREKLDRDIEEVSKRLDQVTHELAVPMVLAVLPASGPVDPKKGPSPEHLAPGKVVRLAWADRYYQLYLPKAYGESQSEQYPLLVVLHPDGSAPEQAEGYFRSLGESRKMIVAMPRAWTSGWETEDDRRFVLDAIVRPLSESLRVDKTRVFITGHGTGGTLCYTLALQNPGLIRGFIPIAARMNWNKDVPRCEGYPVYIIHGGNDKVEPVRSAESAKDRLEKAGYKVLLRRHDKEHKVPEGVLEDGLKFLLENSSRAVGE